MPTASSDKTPVTIVTFTKGREAHLSATLPHMMGQIYSPGYRLVVVDYDSPENEYEVFKRTFAIHCNSLVAPGASDLEAAIAIRMSDLPTLNRSQARNIGALFARRGIIVFVDIDAIVRPGWLLSAVRPLVERSAICTTPDWRKSITAHGRREKGVGILATWYEHFDLVRGYDESFVGWGYEDFDFHNRLCELGPPALNNGGLIQMIRHPQSQRVRFQRTGSTDPHKTKMANIERANNRVGIVNPGGFGLESIGRLPEKIHLWARELSTWPPGEVILQGLSSASFHFDAFLTGQLRC